MGKNRFLVTGFTAHTQAVIFERLPVSMENCEVKRGQTGSFEIVLHSLTKITSSKEFFQIPEEVFNSQSMMNTIEKIYEVPMFKRVTLKAWDVIKPGHGHRT